MKYRYLGSSGLLMSRISLGTMTFGAPDWGCDEKQSHAIIKKYLDGGGNCLDVADIYAGGRSEEIVGNLMPELNRDGIIIASKFSLPSGKAVTQFGANRKQIISSCEKSLKRLKTDYIDLYHVHVPDPVTTLEETLRAMDDLVRQGKVRYIGCSNKPAWQVVEAVATAQARGLENFVSCQDEYSVLVRDAERELIPAMEAYGLGLLPYYPLASGLLTGKYTRGEDAPAGTRFAGASNFRNRHWNERNWDRVEKLEAFVRERGHTLLELAFSWLTAKPVVSSVIAGATRPEQIDANIAAAGWKLDADELAAVDGCSPAPGS